ncbi:holo-ACP synthase [Enterococcus timonensis]|uniref:holo-ACP synthase n=1 Tax=Enterococcus timonensis TaxID=1852364 RepID=UPI0008D923DB|nr:holo-ACP synthase [Enterococcus timonensis]
MIYGIGLDLVELGRLKIIIEEQPRFPQRILTTEELRIYEHFSKRRQLEFLAGRFAGKEAFSKAYGTGIGAVSFQDIEILNHKNGQPYLAQSPFSGKNFVTITHTEHAAMAQVILEN